MKLEIEVKRIRGSVTQGEAAVYVNGEKVIQFGLIVAITSPFVASIMLYEIVGTGAVLSIQSTVAVAVPVFPKSFTNSNVNVPFSVNVYVLFPSLFFIVMLSSELKVAITS